MLKSLVWLISVAAVGWIYLQGRQEHTWLQQQVKQARQDQAELETLRREQLRLRQLARDAADAASLRVQAPIPQDPRSSLLDVDSAVLPVTPLEPGEWSPAGDWRNRGRESPRATIETVLWAAAGGDLARLQEMIHLDDAARELAGGILDRLPAATRELYSSAEHLMAAYTSRSVPLSEAQLVWEQQTGEETAMVCLFVRNPDAAATTLPGPAVDVADRPPPMGSPDFRTRAIYLSLENQGGAWRIVVPATAVQKIAADLGF